MYQHSQVARFVAATMIPAIFIILLIAYLTSDLSILWAGGLFVLIISLFYKLTVTVSHQTVIAKFGTGLIKRTIQIADIDEVSQKKYPWYYGYGIRNIGKGWMFNIAGNMAVELKLKNGKVFWIGTDDPDGLERAIQNWLSA